MPFPLCQWNADLDGLFPTLDLPTPIHLRAKRMASDVESSPLECRCSNGAG